ncbi:MAG: HAMP domain-containing sensor histidine kinase [Chloroflexi bacterium]|nr:HAMP domain-containing sensor histidine kinase [Chloroflexota bacterium]
MRSGWEPFRRHRLISLIIIFGAQFFYVLVFPLLYPFFFQSATVLVLLPICLAGWLLGRRWALLLGAVNFPLNAAMYSFYVPVSVVMLSRSALACGGFAAVGFVVGWLRDVLHESKDHAQLLARSEDILSKEIAERKRAEEKLREAHVALQQHYDQADNARTELHAVLDATRSGLLMVAPDGIIRTANLRFRELFMITPDEVLDQPLAIIQPEFAGIFAESADVWRHITLSLGDVGEAPVKIVRQVWPEPREIELLATTMHAKGGEPAGTLYSFRDVTREREVDRMKSEFIALVSHELRTPLTSIAGYVDLLLAREAGELAPSQDEFLTIVKKNSDRLSALINALLDIARIESGKVELQSGPIDLAGLVQSAAVSVRPQIEAKRQRLVLDLPAAAPPAWGDADRVTQILTNLLSNANKYTPQGGKITVAVQTEDAWMRVAVSDTGIGMTHDEVGQLFTKFFRARNRTTQETGGTGLGLAITRSLVEMQGGEMQVESAAGQGSTLSFTLPLAGANVRALSPSPVGGVADGSAQPAKPQTSG